MEKNNLENTKRCTKCKRRKDLSEFSKTGNYTRSDCRKCHAKYVKGKYDPQEKEKKKTYYKEKKSEITNKVRKNKYKITSEEFAQMLTKQDNKCQICKQELIKPCLDHCHTSNKVRGILCSKCNMGLGCFQDDIENLKSAIKYLSDAM